MSNQEFELKFLSVDSDKLRNNLTQNGGTLIAESYLQQRYVFNNPAHNKSFLRIRKANGKSTFTCKIWPEGQKYADEFETSVGDFDQTLSILQSIGIQPRSYQENQREVWNITVDGEVVEIVIDHWPLLNPYCEIEGGSEELVQKAAQILGFDVADAFYGSTDLVYQKELGIDPEVINTCENISFGEANKLVI